MDKTRKPPLPAARPAPQAQPAIADVDFLGPQALPSVLGTGAPITGKLSFSAPTRIDGTLRGEVRSTALLVVGEHGLVDGIVRAPEVVVLGEVRGTVSGARRVEVGPHGRLCADVETGALIVSDGGIFDGDVRMLGH